MSNNVFTAGQLESTRDMYKRIRRELGFENYSFKDKKSVLPARRDLNDSEERDFLTLMGNTIFSALNGNDSFRFCAHILAFFDRKINNKLPAAAAVSMNTMWFDLWINPYMLMAMTDTLEEIMGVMEHEVFHILMSHLPRAKDYFKSSSVEPLNIAMDCSINQHIPSLPKWVVSLKYVEEICGKKLEANREFEYYYKEMMTDGRWAKFKQERKKNSCQSCAGTGKKQPPSKDYKDGFKDGVQKYKDEKDFKQGYNDGHDQMEQAKKDQQEAQDKADEQAKQDGTEAQQQPLNEPQADQSKSEKYQEGFEAGKQDSKDGKDKDADQAQQDSQQQDPNDQQQGGDQGQQSDQGQPQPSNQGQPQPGQNGQQDQNGQPQQGDGQGQSEDFQKGQQDGYDAAAKADQKGQQGQDGQDGEGDGQGDGQGEGGEQGHGDGQGEGQGQGEPCDCCNGTGKGQGGNNPMGDIGPGMTAEELGQWMDMINGSHEPWEESDNAQKMENFDDMVRDLVDKAESKCRGNVPGHFQSLIDELRKEPEIPWQKELSTLIGSIKIPYKKTRLRLNRRQPQRRDLLGRLPDKTVNVCIAYDTSGSVSDEELSWGFNEAFKVLETVKSDVTIIECDMVVNHVYKAANRSEVNLKPKGRGGTSFTPTFKWIEENNNKFDVIIYFTDGEGEQKIEAEKRGNPKVFWVVTRCKGDQAAREHLSCAKDKKFVHRIKGLYPGYTTRKSGNQ